MPAEQSIMAVSPKQLRVLIAKCIRARQPLLIVGAPGLGKTDICHQACLDVGAKIIVKHPVLDMPEDYKGLGAVGKDGESARFLPFGDLLGMMTATEPTVVLFDDLGQASRTVQAASMQLLRARAINDKAISEHVIFIAASNRRQDKAGVDSILEPVKSRFATIVELVADLESFIEWSIAHNNRPEIRAYLRMRPEHLHDFRPTTDMTNCPMPRTWENESHILDMDLPQELQLPTSAGCIGAAVGTEFVGFLRIYKDLPDVRYIIANPLTAPVPSDNTSVMYALSGALAKAADIQNVTNLFQYLARIPKEFATLVVRDMERHTPQLVKTREVNEWRATNPSI